MAWNHTNCPSLTGIVEVEEGEVNGHELCISSHSISRISFAKEPHVEQVSPTSLSVVPRVFALGSGTTPSDRLEFGTAVSSSYCFHSTPSHGVNDPCYNTWSLHLSGVLFSVTNIPLYLPCVLF